MRGFLGRHRAWLAWGGGVLLVIANANDIYLFFHDTVPEVWAVLTANLALPSLDGFWPTLRVVLSVVGFAMLFYVVVDGRRARHQPAQARPPAAPAPVPLPAPEPRQPRAVEPSPLIVAKSPKAEEGETTEATPQQLWDLFTDRMDIEADQDVAHYIGKRMTVAGPLGGVSPIRAYPTSPVSLIQVTFAFRTFENGVYLMFDGEWLDRLRVIGQGTPITVRGTIERLTRVDLQLKDCEIIRVGGSK